MWPWLRDVNDTSKVSLRNCRWEERRTQRPFSATKRYKSLISGYNFKKSVKTGLFFRISLRKLFSCCRQRITAMKCGIYSELRKRKHFPINHERIYLPCFQLSRMDTHTPFFPSLKILIHLKCIPVNTGSREWSWGWMESLSMVLQRNPPLCSWLGHDHGKRPLLWLGSKPKQKLRGFHAQSLQHFFCFSS